MIAWIACDIERDAATHLPTTITVLDDGSDKLREESLSRTDWIFIPAWQAYGDGRTSTELIEFEVLSHERVHFDIHPAVKFTLGEMIVGDD